MTKRIQNSDNLKKELSKRLEKLQKSLNSDIVTLHLYDGKRDRVYFPVGIGLYQLEHFSRSVPSRKRVVGKIVREKKTIIANDALHHPDITGPFTHLERIKASAGFPVLFSETEEILGVVFVNYREQHTFDETEIAQVKSWIKDLSDFISIVFSSDEGQKLQAKLRQETDLRSKEFRLLSIIKQIREIIRDVDIVFWTENRKKKLLSVSVSDGVDLKYLQNSDIPIVLESKNLVVSTLISNKEYQENNLKAHSKTIFPNQNEPLVWEKAFLLPVSSEYHKLGVLCVLRRDSLQFSPREEDELRTFARLLAVTVRNEDRIVIQNALHGLGINLAQTLDLGTILREVVRSACEILDADIATILQFDSDKEVYLPLETVAVYPESARQYMETPRFGGLADRIIQNKERVFAENIGEENQSSFVKKQDIKAYVGLPLISNQIILGILFISFKQSRLFSPDELTLIQLLADNAAAAIRNAQLYNKGQQKNKRLNLVREVAAKISSTTDVNQILQLVVDGLADVFSVEQSAVALFDENGEFSVIVAEFLGDNCLPSMGTQIPLKNNLQVEEILRTKKPVIVSDVESDRLLYKILKERGTRSIMIVPIIIDDEVIGTVGVDSVGIRREFTEDEAQLAMAIANQAAVAIRNARLFEQVKTRADALKSLHEVGPELISLSAETESLHNVLRQIAESAKEVLGASLIDLYQYRQSRDEFILPPIQLGKRNAPDIDKDEILEDDILYSIIALDQPKYTEKVLDDEVLTQPFSTNREGQSTDRYVVRESIESSAAIPLAIGNEKVGVLFANYRPPQKFDSDQRELIELFANQAAIAIRNARVYQARQTINEVGQALTEGIRLQEGEILKLIHEKAGGLMDVDNMYVALYNDETLKVSFPLAFVAGDEIYVETRKGGKGRTEWIINEKEPIFIRTKEESINWYEKFGYDYLKNPLASWIGVPMISGEKVLGVIATYHPTKDYVYSEDDREILQTMANQAAIALDNINYKNRIIESLADFAKVMSSGILVGESDIMELIRKTASGLMDTDNMYIALYDEVTQMIRFGLMFVEGEGVDFPSRRMGEAGKGKTEVIIETKKHILHETQKEAKEWYQQPGHTEFQKGGIYPSWVGVPMISGKKVLGVIAAYHTTKDHIYNQDDLATLQVLANQAVGLLKYRQRIENIREVTRTISTEIELDRCMDKILETVMSAFACSYATIQFVEDDELVIQAQKGTEGRILDPKLHSIKIGEGVTGMAAKEKVTIRVGDVSEDERYLDYINDTRSEMATPLIQRDEVVGVLNVEDVGENSFDHDDEVLFEILAEEIVIAIQTVRRYEERAKLREETARSRSSRAIVHSVGGKASKIRIWAYMMIDQLERESISDDDAIQELRRIAKEATLIDQKITEAVGKQVVIEEPQSIKIHDVVEDVLNSVNEELKQNGVEVDNNIERNLPEIVIDSTEFGTTILELIVNAGKALERIEKTKWVRLTSKVIGDEIEIYIANNGVVIPEEDWEEIFSGEYDKESYQYRTGARQGLLLARQFIRDYNGNLSVIKSDTEETIFKLVVPITRN